MTLSFCVMACRTVRPPFPLTDQVICMYLTAIINDESRSDLWKVERITGWIEAMIENSPQTFMSALPEQRKVVRT